MKISFLNTPEFLSLPIFGLSISQSFIRLAKLNKKNKRYIPDLITEVALTETCDFFTDSNPTSQCEHLKKHLIELKKKHNISFAHISIPEEHTYVFKILIPKDALLMISEFITNNIEQYIPLSVSEVYFDYKILKSHMSQEQVPVVITAIPKNIVEKYTVLFDSCGIFVVGCEPETHAITRAVIDKSDNNPYIILNIDEHSTSVAIVEDGLVQYTQTIAITSNDISNVISPATFTLLKDSINRIIIYWFTSKEQSLHNTKIEHVVLVGSGAYSSELINFFENNLSVHATHAQVWKNCFNLEEYIPTIAKKDSLKYATCIGLSMFKLK